MVLKLLYRQSPQGCDLASLFGGLSQSEKLSEINPPLASSGIVGPAVSYNFIFKKDAAIAASFFLCFIY
jgi:hypothetical protein